MREVFEKAAGMVSTMPNLKASNFLKIGGKDVAGSSMAGDHLVGILKQLCKNNLAYSQNRVFRGSFLL